jgi:hypothetical protein
LCWLVALGIGVTQGACGGQSVAPDASADAGPRVDRQAVQDGGGSALDPAGDSDGDGLCNGTEARIQSDPRRADSDGDGLLDSFEVSVGSDPRNGFSPRALDRVRVVEGDVAVLTVEHLLEWRGEGEVLNATVQDGLAGFDGRVASSVVASEVAAVEANPAAFVRDINGPRFVGVIGRTLLRWRVTMTPQAGAPAGCARAYEALLSIRREGVDTVQLRRLVVEAAPASRMMGADAGVRVSPEGLCLPATCF